MARMTTLEPESMMAINMPRSEGEWGGINNIMKFV